jgi:uncharacterized protein YecE (DUF72 family)
MYCRLHGSEILYVNGYDNEALEQWTGRVCAWARGTEPQDAERVIKNCAAKLPARDVFVYFDNDVKVRAPFDAKSLTERVDKILPR